MTEPDTIVDRIRHSLHKLVVVVVVPSHTFQWLQTRPCIVAQLSCITGREGVKGGG